MPLSNSSIGGTFLNVFGKLKEVNWNLYKFRKRMRKMCPHTFQHLHFLPEIFVGSSVRQGSQISFSVI